MTTQDFAAKFAAGNGFIAALDQSGGSTPKALRGYGISDDQWSGDDEMFAEIHKMRSRVITSPCFGNGKVIGAILFEKTMDGAVDGKPAPEALKERGIAPFIKVDQGLAEEADGVQLMKPLDKLDALLEKSVAKGMYGTKMRSVIKSANAKGIAAIVAQQFEVGNRIIAAGLMPILEPEFDITAEDREAGEDILKAEILKHLDAQESPVMLKLSIPVKPGHYQELVDHPMVLSVVALSGGYTTDEACAELAKNPGMIASFSRATLQDLRVDQSDAEFDAALGQAIDKIHAASVA
ncbi:fructose bisphosphate aldolase [Aurantiacibacter sp. MUD11]|uniref:fructose bisphosphate aldolase n=1 Tax=Aurantiacibacter sp. MUD11 TaxID=3003265 RepID=UPI0022AA821B|nr:fructose bisphosphate aldolase [Aurantiacibacter sp. MUD11]WAT18216.1 fructose bisphosphate aldolase [Aurantiacibacter sp. MUD11]